MTASSKLVKQFDVYWVELDPAKGSEIKKTRPCIVISPDETNEALKTVMVVPLTSTVIDWPFRVTIKSLPKKSSAACDQLRTISKQRLRRKAGALTKSECHAVLGVMQAIFSE